MDDKSLVILEFPKIREILAGHCSFSASRQLALELKPSSQHELIALLLRQSAEARHLLSLQPYLSLAGVQDVRDVAQAAAKGMLLEPQNLTEVQTALTAAREWRTNVERLAQQLPSLWTIAEGIIKLPDLEKQISGSISPPGEVLESASAELANLRYQAKGTRRRLLESLQAIIESPSGQKFTQEPIITERDNRYVILVKMEMRHDVRGIVHDISSSGATAFVEPWTTVDTGNELRELIIEERREVERILRELSALVGENQPAISQNMALLAKLDLALGKARYAHQAKAVEPLITMPAGDGQRGA
ncbi:MAG: endonuclease MutS2, partial [Chloroflexi bacterium]|nr:endonuclease MutS2 [Chloroflexota bacterium]